MRTVEPWAGSGTTGLLLVGAAGQAFVANTAAPRTPISDAGDFVDQSGGGGSTITPAGPRPSPGPPRTPHPDHPLDQTSVTLPIRARGAYAIQ